MYGTQRKRQQEKRALYKDEKKKVVVETIEKTPH